MLWNYVVSVSYGVTGTFGTIKVKRKENVCGNTNIGGVNLASGEVG